MIAVGLSAPAYPVSLMQAVQLQNITAEPFDIQILFAQAQGNPATVLLTPVTALGSGRYRVTLRGGGELALTAVSGASLSSDYSFTFTVDTP